MAKKQICFILLYAGLLLAAFNLCASRSNGPYTLATSSADIRVAPLEASSKHPFNQIHPLLITEESEEEDYEPKNEDHISTVDLGFLSFRPVLSVLLCKSPINFNPLQGSVPLHLRNRVLII